MSASDKRNNAYRARKRVGGKRLNKTFNTQKEANHWLYTDESNTQSRVVPDKCMAHYLNSYLKDVVPLLADPAKDESYIKFLLTQSWMNSRKKKTNYAR